MTSSVTGGGGGGGGGGGKDGAFSSKTVPATLTYKQASKQASKYQ
jgi:hypothetical protein